MENPIKMDDLGVPPFKETPIYLAKVAVLVVSPTRELALQIHREVDWIVDGSPGSWDFQ